MTDQSNKEAEEGRQGLDRLAEDSTGFGMLEARTAWALVARPAQALEAWMTAGPTGGDLYARPLRLYLALNGILMLILFLRGGTEIMLGGFPTGFIDPVVAASGKSRELFMADFDGWTTLVLVPILSAFYALAAAPLLRWWDPDDLGWRRAFRAAFAYLCAWTVPLIPFAWFSFDPQWATPSAILLIGLGVVAFWRMGSGRWWRSPMGALGKGLALSFVLQIAGMIGYIPVLIIGLLGARFGP